MKQVIHTDQLGFRHGRALATGDYIVSGRDERQDDVELFEVNMDGGRPQLRYMILADLPPSPRMIGIGNEDGFTAVSPEFGTDWNNLMEHQEEIAADMATARGEW